MGNKGMRTRLEIAFPFSAGRIMLPSMMEESWVAKKFCCFFKQNQNYLIVSDSPGGSSGLSWTVVSQGPFRGYSQTVAVGLGLSSLTRSHLHQMGWEHLAARGWSSWGSFV